MSTQISADTTDRQIAVRAAKAYFLDGAPPRLCERLVAVAQHIHRLPAGGWPETRQAWWQARETFERLDVDAVQRIVADVRRMESAREKSRRQRELATAGRLAAPYQPIVDAIVRSAAAAGERPNNDEYFGEVVAVAYPELPRDIVAAISKVCVHRLRMLD